MSRVGGEITVTGSVDAYEPPRCEAWAVTGRSRSSLITLTLPLVDARMLTVVHTVEPLYPPHPKPEYA